MTYAAFTLAGFRAIAIGGVLLLPAFALAAEELVLRQHHDGVLGTSLDVTIYGADMAAMEQAAAAALDEIARLEQILSTYRTGSELMLLNAARATDSASPELLDVVQHCNVWQAATAGKFSCRLGGLQALWAEAAASQQLPERPAVRSLARAISQAELFVDADRHAIRLGEPIALDPSGLAKGYIIDRAMAVLRASLPNAQAIKLDIGGDALYHGHPAGQHGWEVAVADPNDIADNQGFLATLALNSKAVAASGHRSRTHTIGRRKFSHILVARDGWPVEDGTSAIVVADSAIVADAVATALSVQALTDGIDWINTLEGVEALVIDSAGHQLNSSGWSALLAEGTDSGSSSGFGQLTLDYALPAFEIAAYNRPYLAIWISDAEQAPLKNLLLLGENERWARENSRWWRRVGRRNPELLDGVARPTRGPGEYQVQWDGRDDFGAALPPGSYLLHLEASRENGGSSYQALPFSWGSDGEQSLQLAPEGELGAIHLQISNGQQSQSSN